MTYPPEARFAPAGKVRLRDDHITGQLALVSPERGLFLNDSAAEIVRAFAEGLSLSEVIDRLLATSVGASRAEIEADVQALLASLIERRLMVSRP